MVSIKGEPSNHPRSTVRHRRWLKSSDWAVFRGVPEQLGKLSPTPCARCLCMSVQRGCWSADVSRPLFVSVCPSKPNQFPRENTATMFGEQVSSSCKPGLRCRGDGSAGSCWELAISVQPGLPAVFLRSLLLPTFYSGSRNSETRTPTRSRTA